MALARIGLPFLLGNYSFWVSDGTFARIANYAAVLKTTMGSNMGKPDKY